MRNVYLFSAMSPTPTGTTREGITTTGPGFVRIDLEKPFILTKIMLVIQSDTSGAMTARGFEVRLTDMAAGRRLFQVNDNGVDDGWLPANLFCGRSPMRSSNGFLDMSFPELPEECEIPAGGLIQIDLQYRPTPGVIGQSFSGTAYLSLMGYTYE